MKVIIILCRTRSRKNDLNNFAKNRFNSGYVILSFCGPIFFYIGKLFRKFNHFKSVKFFSIDAIPIIKTSEGINYFMDGKIRKKGNMSKYNDCYTSMKSIFHNYDRIFQIYPIIKKKLNIKKKRKIIFVSSINCVVSNRKANKMWEKSKKNINLDFNIFEKKKFWLSHGINPETTNVFYLYKILKNKLREHIIKIIIINFQDNFILIGTEWKNYIKDFNVTDNIYDKNYNFYENNICLDLGSIKGSLTLYARSMNILENLGCLFQLKQKDANTIYGKKEDYFTFKNKNDLIKKLTKLLNNDLYYKNYFNKLVKHHKSISYTRQEKEFKKIFN